MALQEIQKEKIRNLLSGKIEDKLSRYSRETTSMPFLARLIQDSEKIAAYSFIHSLATSLGMSLYEEVSKIVVESTATEVFTKYGVGGVLSKEQKYVINKIVTQLRNNERSVNINDEIEEVLKSDASNGEYQKSGDIADLYFLRDGIEHFVEIKTVKPNIDVFEKSKTKILEWIGRRRKYARVLLAFPYNPYFPKPYSHFTVQGVMDLGNDFLIGKEYWDFLGGPNTFEDVLGVFDKVGKYYKEKLHTKFKEIASQKIDSY